MAYDQIVKVKKLTGYNRESSIAQLYCSTKTYTRGTYVVQGHQVWRCTADSVTGAWDQTKWELVPIGDALRSIDAYIEDESHPLSTAELEELIGVIG